MYEAILALDHTIFRLIYDAATSVEALSGIAVFFAEWLPYLVIALVLVQEFFIDDDDKQVVRSLFDIALPSLVAGGFAFTTKLLYHAPRPFAGEGNIAPLISVGDPFGSFPSLHATLFGALAGTLIVRRSKFLPLYLTAVILIGIGRIATGVHWPIDVFVGLFFGLTVGFFLEKLLFKKTARQ